MISWVDSEAVLAILDLDHLQTQVTPQEIQPLDLVHRHFLLLLLSLPRPMVTMELHARIHP